jgi:ribosome biogenesis protein ERB1
MQRYIPAPKLKPPGHEESYNPPPEYLMTEEEEQKWRDQEPEERRINVIPKKYSNLRSVPSYPDFVKERFERCLDLYLCPRARKMRANVNPEDLIPKLPKPRELQPFPSIQSMIYTGHTGVVRCVSVEPKGQYMVSGSDDCTLKVWEILTGRCVKTIQFEASVSCVAWCPDESKCLCAIAVDKELFVINPGLGDKMVSNDTDTLFEMETESQAPESESQSSDLTVVDWQTMTTADSQWKSGFRVSVKHRFEIKQISWHRRGDYIASVMPSGGNRSVVIHQLSKKRSQVPFRKSKGIIQCVLFHPSKPYFFVATQRYVRIYNLMKQELSKKLMTNCKYVSSLAIHPGGDNVLVGSYDLRLNWFDLDLSTKPYKSLRYHKKAIRKVAYHPKYPLFASASDDGTAIVSHGMVYSDLMMNPLIVPVKVLRGHKMSENLGVLDCIFHPNQPWLLTAGADHTLRLFT